MFKTRNLLLLLVLLAGLVLAACGGGDAEESSVENESSDTDSSTAGDTYDLKVGHIAPPDHALNVAAEKLAEELDERSDGRMTLEIYPGGQLGSDADMVQQIESGSLDFGFITNAYVTSMSEAFSAWFAPFIFDSYEEAFEASNTEIAEEILA